MAIDLTLIAMPRGVTQDGQLAVSILVSPKLTGDSLLGAFPLMLAWTASLQAEPPRIVLSFAGTQVDAAFDGSVLRPDIWGALFDENTPVEPFVFDDASDRLVVSYRTRDALRLVKGAYQSITTTGSGSVPGAEGLAREIAGFALPEEGTGVDAMNRRTRAMLLKQLSGGGRRRDFSRRPQDESLRDFALFSRMPQPSPDAPDPLPRTEAQLAEVIDFHKALTSIAAHPALMRALGLVLDVTLKADAVALAGAAGMPFGALSVARFGHARSERAANIVTPSVLYQHRLAASGGSVFAAADDADDMSVVEGWLSLPEDAFHLLDLDIDGALSKLVGLATMSGRAMKSPTADGALPALRSAGLSLAANDRGGEVIETLQRAAAINAALGAGPQTVLRARDLVRGYRLDVWSAESGRWRSLHRRRATYQFGEDGAAKLDAVEEGYAQFAAASPAPDPSRIEDDPDHPVEDDLYVHEVIARWTGWSLSAPRPGRPIHRSDPHDPLKKDETEDAFATAFKMRMHFVPEPRSLPRLRFGHRYRIRARVVDIAGNSPASTDLEAGPAGTPGVPIALPPGPETQPYFRYEPIPHPVLVLRNVPESGRPAVDRIVIRSFNSDPSLDGSATMETDERHIAPPRAAVDLVERHGLLDDAMGRLKGDAATFDGFVARDDAAFPMAPIGDPPKEAPVVASERLTVDYSPDPLALAAAFRDLPGVVPGRVAFAGQSGTADLTDGADPQAGPVMQIGFGGDWPQRLAFRVVLAEGEAPPAWDQGRRVLTVHLPKGSVAHSRLSAAPAERDLPLLGVWAWQRDYLDERARKLMNGSADGLAQSLESLTALGGRLLRLALEGGQWALTPSIPVHFIHAVQQPLGLPQFVPSSPDLLATLQHDGGLSTVAAASEGAPLVAVRDSRSTDATLIGGLDIHLGSTGRVDIAARWRDIADSDDTPDGIAWTSVRTSLEPILLGNTSGTVPAQGATSRNVAAITAGGKLAFLPRRYVNGAMRAAAAPVQRFGDTRHRIVTYEATTTTRFETDFPADRNLVFTRTGPPVSIVVPSSAPPPAPTIVSVVPTFGWRREKAGTLTASVRSGQGIRVHLERPWFSSGEGELLGVVLWRRNSTPPSDDERRDRYAGRVTEWGLDPVRKSGRLVAMPNFTQMRGSAQTRENVYCAEFGRSVDLVGYETHFDPERGQRYADIVFAADTAYMPFVRMALVRFQPNSIAGAEISSIATADFLQLTPDRSAMLIADPMLPNLYRLSISGFAPTPSPAAPWRNKIEVALEERIDDIATDLNWRPAAGGIATITETTPGSTQPAVLYSGLVEFATVPAATRYRLVVREYETWEADPPPRLLQPAAFDVGRLGIQKTQTVTGSNSSPSSSSARTQSPASPTPVLVTRANSRVTDTRVSSTARAIDRLGTVLTGPSTKRRLVYAEFIAIDPPAGRIVSSSDGPIGLGAGSGIGAGAPEVPGASGTPGVGMIDPALIMSEDPPWPPDAGPASAPLVPRWEDQPELEANDAMEPLGVIKLAQAMLNAIGLLPVPLQIDGVFTGLMEGAIRLLRQQASLPDSGALDATTWTALAVAAPFPVLEPGIGEAPMSGPSVALVQRLLNLTASEPIDEDGVYSPATQTRVALFQQERGLTETGIVGPETWNAIATLFDYLSPVGAEQVHLHFERSGLVDGAGVALVERVILNDVPTPPSAATDEAWGVRAGLWLELQDAQQRVLFRHVFGFSLAGGREAVGDADTGAERSHAAAPIDRADLVAVLPILAAARRLVVYANVSADDNEAAAPIATFDNW